MRIVRVVVQCASSPVFLCFIQRFGSFDFEIVPFFPPLELPLWRSACSPSDLDSSPPLVRDHN